MSVPPPSLAGERSAFLRAHAHDPVGWLPWGEFAFERARAMDRPILLSIGFSACHACKEMHATSFADPDTVAFIAEHYVPVLVDREERPDVDGLYVHTLLDVLGQAGWPATLFLFPDGRPFTGATFLPPEPRHGLPSLREVLEGVQTLWNSDRETLDASANALRRSWIEKPPPPDAPSDPVATLIGLHDAEFGGFGDGAKFPQVPENELMLLAAVAGHEPARRAIQRTLEEMAVRALHDPIGGGFHRYTVDRAWLLPHFEKMLSDNVQLLRLYARAAHAPLGAGRAAAENRRRAVEVVRRTVRWLRAELAHPGGGFCASLSADDPRGEGAYYTWTPDEVREVLGPVDLPYGIGTGRGIPTALQGEPERSVRERLAEARAHRPRPPRDKARVVAWNGLAVSALAEAGRLLGMDDLVDSAARTAELLLSARRRDGLLPHRIGDERPGLLEDQAHVAEGLLALYQARPTEPRWLREAHQLTLASLRHFSLTDGGLARSRAPDLPVQVAVYTDEAEPSGAGVMAEVLRRLAVYGALDPQPLHRLLTAADATMQALPAACATLHAVRSAVEHPPPVLVLAGAPDAPEVQAMLRAWDRVWRPHGLVALVTPDAPQWALFQDRTPGAGGVRAWLRRDAREEVYDTAAELEQSLR